MILDRTPVFDKGIPLLFYRAPDIAAVKTFFIVFSNDLLSSQDSNPKPFILFYLVLEVKYEVPDILVSPILKI